MTDHGAVGDFLEALGKRLDGLGVGDHQHRPSGDAQHAERGDERRELGVGDQQAVDHSQDSAEQDAGEDRHRDRHPGHQQLRGHRSREAEHRADRQVDAGGQDHQELADRQDPEDRHLAGEVGQVVAGEELLAGQGERSHRHQQDHQAPALPAGDVAQSAHPVAGGPCRASGGRPRRGPLPRQPTSEGIERIVVVGMSSRHISLH